MLARRRSLHLRRWQIWDRNEYDLGKSVEFGVREITYHWNLKSHRLVENQFTLLLIFTSRICFIPSAEPVAPFSSTHDIQCSNEAVTW